MADPTEVNDEPIESTDRYDRPVVSPVETRVAPPAHPLIWAALLLWLTVEAIGDGVLALVSLLSSVNVTAMTTPSTATPSLDTVTTADSIPTPTPTPS